MTFVKSIGVLSLALGIVFGWSPSLFAQPESEDVGVLPIPPAPPVPAAPTEFAATPRDPAGQAARQIARMVPRFPNFRAEIAGATWRVEPSAVWSIRPARECVAALRELGIRFQLQDEMETPVPTPVRLLGQVDGVSFIPARPEQPVIISCELATRLPQIVEVLKRYAITRVVVASSYRTGPRTSFHTMGLALDISAFISEWGRLRVAVDYQPTPMELTCAAPPQPGTRDPAEALRSIACELHQTNLFQSVLTPNYNAGHRDHFHVDMRPDDARLFVR